MARFIKRGNSWQYEISYKDENGKYKKLRKSGFPRKADAIAEAGEIEMKMSKGMKVTKKDIYLYDHFQQWMSVYKKGKVSNVTFRKYENTLMNINKFFKNDTVKSMNRTKYQQRLNEFSKNHANASVKRLNSNIRASIANLVDEGIISYDFTKGAIIKGESPSVSEQDKFLHYEEFERLMNLVKKDLDPRYSSRFMILIAGATGMRFGELLGLTWDRIDIEKGLILVDRAWDYADSKKFCPTKNTQSVRTIGVDASTKEILKTFKKEQAALFKKLDIKLEHDFVFYNVKDGIISNNAVNKKLKEFLSQLKISTPLTIHGLRHTHASVLIFKGINILAVSKHLGHKNIAVTMETYTHAVKELEEQENEQIKKVFNDIYKK